MEQENQISKSDNKNYYDKIYKILFLIPLIILILSLGYLYNFNKKTSDIIYKDVSLTGGTSFQVNSDADINALRSFLETKFKDVSVRQISDLQTGKQIAFIIETKATPDEIKPVLEKYLGFKLTSENHSVEFTGSSLSQSFYNQLKFAILLAFIFMALVVFIIFRTPAPSFAVILAAFSDIVMTIVTIDILGIKLSTAGIIAVLMLIGYSVDTDILLTTRVIKRKEGTINKRLSSAFKTGITMTLTSLAVVLIGLFMTSSFSKILNQIFTVLTIGLLFDIFNTWFANASIIKWYAHKKNLE